MNRKALEEAFALFDRDGDGSITSAELLVVMRSLGQHVTDQETKKMVEKVDRDGNGLIDLNEFILMMGTKLDDPTKKDSEVRSLFAAFDKDNSGYIDKSEVKKTMKDIGFDLSKKDVETMMKAAGVANKDKIFYEDFMRMMSTMATPRNKSLLATEPTIIYSPEEKKIQDLRIAFSMFDKDGDGKISSKEVYQTLNSIGMKVDLKSAKKMVMQVDLDGNGSICFEEFQQLMKNHYGSTISLSEGGLDLKEIFEIFDKDHDGFLNAADLKDTMQQLGISLSDSDVYDMMKTVNVERKGQISFRDFERLLYLNEEKMSRVSSMMSVNSINKIKHHQDKEGLQAVFSIFDKDGDGFITMEEVEKVLKKMNISTSQEYIKEIFEQVDLDGNGQIDFDEFVLLTTRYENMQSDEQEIEEMFRIIDKDRSGSIESHELIEAFVALGVPISEKDVQEMLKEAHVEGNTIYYDDFIRIMKMLGPSGQMNQRTKPVEKEVRRSKSNPHQTTQRQTSKEPVERKSSNHRQQRTSTSSQSSTNSNLWVPPTSSRRRRTSSTTWEAFKVFDHNCDGYISKRELFETMKQLGIKLTIEDLNEMMKQADINGDGKIDYSEFVKLMTGTFESYAEQAALLHRQNSQKSNVLPKFYDLPGDEEMRASFKVFDINGDGFIDSSELRQTLKSFGNQISDEEVENMLKTADTNGDGRIGYEEFIEILHAK